MKKNIILTVLLVLMMLPAGCVSGSREQMVEGIKKHLAEPEGSVPGNDYSELEKSWEETGEKAGNLFDDLSELAGMAGSDIGDGLSAAASGLGKGIGEAADSLGEALGKDVSDLYGDADAVLGPYHILKVVDGDTVKLTETGKDVRYRLIGVDTPESVADEEYLEASGKENTQEGRDASSFMKEYLPKGTEVYIEYDAGREDKYGRQLIYLYAVKDGERVFVNELLLAEGYARMLTLQPNVRYADTVFLEAQRHAQENGKGFWGTGFFEEG